MYIHAATPSGISQHNGTHYIYNGLFWTCEGQFSGWGYFGLARDNFRAGAILDLEGQFWGWGYFELARDNFGAGANLDLRGTILGLGLLGLGLGLGLGVWVLSLSRVLLAISRPYFVSLGSVWGTQDFACGFCPFFVSFLVPKCPFPIFRCPLYRIDVSLPHLQTSLPNCQVSFL